MHNSINNLKQTCDALTLITYSTIQFLTEYSSGYLIFLYNTRIFWSDWRTIYSSTCSIAHHLNICEKHSAMLQLMHIFVQKYPPLSIASYSFIQLSDWSNVELKTSPSFDTVAQDLNRQFKDLATALQQQKSGSQVLEGWKVNYYVIHLY